MHAGLLDFFVLEASECVERLDGLMARAAGAPDLAAFTRDARALRGSATMAKVQGIADVSSALERIAKGLQDGGLHWSDGLKAAVIAAIDDLKILIRGVRTWGSEEERRAADRAEELKALAPARRRSGATPSVTGGSAGFLATEMAEVSSGLERFAANPGPIATFDETLRRVRALRGVAALLDLPPLAEVIATVDESAKRLELGAAASGALQDVFRAAATVLREGSDAVHGGGRPDPASPAVSAFAVAADALVEGAGDADRVVPISTLFPDGGGLVHAAPNPPTTPAHRFKLEAVSQAEHLRRLVFDARGAADAPTRQRVGRELRGAVRSLARAAESFSEHAVARAMHALVDAAASLEERALGALEEASTLLTTPGATPLSARFDALAGASRATPGVPTPVGTPAVTPIVTPAVTPVATPVVLPAAPTPAPPVWRVSTPPAGASLAPTPLYTPAVGPLSAPAARRAPSAATPPVGPAPAGTALHEMLGAGIAGLSKLDDEPMSEPAPVEDDGTVAIQDLLYRGKAALRRAMELGDQLKKAAAEQKPADAEALAELYDLLELAATE